MCNGRDDFCEKCRQGHSVTEIGLRAGCS